VTAGTAISLAFIAHPESTVAGRLISLEGRYAEAVLDGEAPLKRGALVRFQTPETLYLGEIEAGWTEAGSSRIRVLIEHAVDLEKAAAVRRLWNSD
jgi:hypothetical protein